MYARDVQIFPEWSFINEAAVRTALDFDFILPTFGNVLVWRMPCALAHSSIPHFADREMFP